MRPGRSAWTLAVVALGVGALFLVGWRMGGGDALSAPSIDSAYFAVDVASSGPRGRREKEQEEEEEERREEERAGIERKDRSASNRDYSQRDERRARSKGSSPPSNLESGSTIDFGRRKRDEGRNENGSRSRRATDDKLLFFPWRNLENGEEEEEEREEARTILRGNLDDDEGEEGSRSIGWGGSTGDKVAVSSELAKREGNRVDDSTKISFPWNPEREEDENSRRYSSERVVGRSRESLEGEDDRESTSYSVSSSSPLRVDWLASLNPEEEKDGIKDDSSWTSYPVSSLETKERRVEDENLEGKDSSRSSINLEKNYEEKRIDRSLEEKSDRGSKEENSLPPWNFVLETEVDREEDEWTKSRKRSESYREESASRRENDREASEDPITKGIDLPSSQKRRRGEDGFSTDDDGRRTRTGTLNGSSERSSSDVEENLSREVNGRSMNEVEKSSGRSYHYLGSGNGHSLTSRGEPDARANRGETEAKKVESIGPETESGHPLNRPRSNEKGWRRVPWNANKEDRSISIEVGTRWNEIVADFHNSERADAVERGGESISPDSYPPATPRLFFRRDRGSTRSSEGERSLPLEVHSPTIDIRAIDENLEDGDDDDLKEPLRFGREESFDEREFLSAVEGRHEKEEEEEEDLGGESSENLEEEETGDEWSRGVAEGKRSFRKIGSHLHGEKRAGRIRGRRYANYYSQQSATPMAYVHIQPVYPVAQAPPPNRKCVQCMVVYKPCPSTPRQPPFPTYKYQELASKWFGLKYGK